MSLFLKLLRFLGALLAVVFGVVALILSYVSLHMVIRSGVYLCSEKVHEISLSEYKPELDGCLVRVHVTEIRAGKNWAMENYFDFPVPGAVLVSSYISGEQADMPRDVQDLADITGTYAAPQVMAGIFELKGMKAADYGGSICKVADCSRARLMPGVKKLAKSVTPEYIELRVADTHGVPYRIAFNYAPSPHKVNLYLIARQNGKCLEVQDMLRGEAVFRNATRVRTPGLVSVSAFVWRTVACVLLSVLCLWLFIRLGHIRLEPISYYRAHPVQHRVLRIVCYSLTILCWLVTGIAVAYLITKEAFGFRELFLLAVYILPASVLFGISEAIRTLDVRKACVTGLWAIPTMLMTGIVYAFLLGGMVMHPTSEYGVIVALAVALFMYMGLYAWKKIRKKRVK